MCPIIQHPRSAVQVLPTADALRLLHRDEQASGPTPASIEDAKDYQAAERARLVADLAADPDGRDALLSVIRSFR
jgi:hypothetical protein